MSEGSLNRSFHYDLPSYWNKNHQSHETPFLGFYFDRLKICLSQIRFQIPCHKKKPFHQGRWLLAYTACTHLIIGISKFAIKVRYDNFEIVIDLFKIRKNWPESNCRYWCSTELLKESMCSECWLYSKVHFKSSTKKYMELFWSWYFVKLKFFLKMNCLFVSIFPKDHLNSQCLLPKQRLEMTGALSLMEYLKWFSFEIHKTLNIDIHNRANLCLHFCSASNKDKLPLRIIISSLTLQKASSLQC